MDDLFPGFSAQRVAAGEVALAIREGGAGPALILLHGFPQNHRCWAPVAPAFARHFRVVVPDLRGYGDSDAPPDDAAHTTYSKRRMAADIVAMMDALGIARAHLLGHDRGARVAYRLALDHPDRVDRLGILEVVPTSEFWAAWSADLALAAWHWTFLAQPAPIPERLIAADPSGFTDHLLASWTRARDLSPFAPAALASYRAQMADPARRAAMCADYRAGATTDRALDLADRAAGHRIAAPLCFLWAESGFAARTGDPLGIWRRWASRVSGASCVAGHFAVEEAPGKVFATFLPFFLGEGAA
jgi:haloacetate dehalogenase